MHHKQLQESGATPLELPELLLLAAPEVLTLQKLFVLPAFTERSHQFAGVLSGCNRCRQFIFQSHLHQKYLLIKQPHFQSQYHLFHPSSWV